MRVTRSLLLAPVLFLCSGCGLWVTYHLDPISPRREIDDQTVQSFIVGSTTIEDVLLRLGEPQDYYEAPTVFLYRWILRKGFSFLLGGKGASSSVTTEYTLHILFDAQNKVARYKISSVILWESIRS